MITEEISSVIIVFVECLMASFRYHVQIDVGMKSSLKQRNYMRKLWFNENFFLISSTDELLCVFHSRPESSTIEKFCKFYPNFFRPNRAQQSRLFWQKITSHHLLSTRIKLRNRNLKKINAARQLQFGSFFVPSNNYWWLIFIKLQT